MQLETLDFYEFFKDEYSLLNGGEGVGASGIITPLQMINVVNLPKKDEITREKGDWGSGYHIDTYQKIFELIYQLNDEPNWINSNKKAKSKIITDLLERTITIRYTNQYQRTIVKNILIKIPAYVTEFSNIK